MTMRAPSAGCGSALACAYKNADMAWRVSTLGNREECTDKLGELVRAHLLLNAVFDQMEQIETLSSDVVPQL
jgi:hypothetical protein